MVLQNAVDNLKDKPHDEKKAVASGIAIGVVIILLVGWGFLFLRKIQRGTIPTLESGAVPQDQFDTAFLKETQQQINQLYSNPASQLEEIRDTAAQNAAGGNFQNSESVDVGAQDDQFGAQESAF